MNFLKRIIVFCLFVTFVAAVPSVAVTSPGSKDLGTVIVNTDSSYYGSVVQLRVDNDLAQDIKLTAQIELLSCPAGIDKDVMEDILRQNFKWDGQYISPGQGSFSSSSSMPYYDDVVIATIGTGQSNVNITLGTDIYIPQVCPVGNYSWRITYIVP